MLNEPASSSIEQPVWRDDQSDHTEQANPYTELREIVEDYLEIAAVLPPDADNTELDGEVGTLGPSSRLVVTFAGKLKQDSETAYAQLDEILKVDNQFALFRRGEEGDDQPHLIRIVQGRVVPVEGQPWVNIALFIATLFSVLLLGAQIGLSELYADNPSQLEAIAGDLGAIMANLWRGYPYAISIMLILGAHELGHYFAARFHKQAASLPYFIPLPPPLSLFGTLGAFIRLREPMRNRKVLMDVGAAGPLAGMIFAIPILLIGLATSPVRPVEGGLLEGNSLIYALAKVVTFGQFLPGGGEDVFLNQMAWAGWTGLLVTALNLMPVGQLDGGHIVYSLFGKRARLLYFPVILAMMVLAVISQVWIFWVLLLLLFGRIYAAPLDNITPLDQKRQIVAVASIVLFILIFVPRPFRQLEIDADPVPQNTVYVQPESDLTVGPQ